MIRSYPTENFCLVIGSILHAWRKNLGRSVRGTELPISNVRCYGEFRGQSGLIVLILSFVESDPRRPADARRKSLGRKC
jgi:hypothetical protein